MAEGLLSIQKRKTPKEATSKNKQTSRYNATGKTYQPQKVRRERVQHGILKLYSVELHSFSLLQEAGAKTTFNLKKKLVRITHCDKFMKLDSPPSQKKKPKLNGNSEMNFSA